MQLLAVRHMDPKTMQPIGDSFIPLSGFCDHERGLRFLLEGLNGFPSAIGLVDPGVNAAGQYAAAQREAGIEPSDAGYPPAVAAALWYQAMRQREQDLAAVVADAVSHLPFAVDEPEVEVVDRFE